MAIQLSEVPCDCMFPPFQCNVTNEAFLPINQENGTVYVVTNQPGREPYPMMYWNGVWIPLDDYVVSATLDGNILNLIRKEGEVITVDLSSLVLADTFVESVSLVDTTLTLTRNDAVTLSVNLNTLPDLHVTNLQLTGNTLRLTRSDATTFDVDLSGYVNIDTNNYVNGVSLAGSTLTLSRLGLSDLSQNLASINTDTNNYVNGISLAGTTLTLTRLGLDSLTQNLSSINTDTNNYVDGSSFDYTNLTLSRLGLTDVVTNLRQPNMGARLVFPVTIAAGVENVPLSLDSTLMYGNNVADFWSAAQPSRITPNVFGRYIITAWVQIECDTVATNEFVRFEVRRHGTPDGIAATTTTIVNSTIDNRVFATGHTYISVAGDYIDVQFSNFGANNMTIVNGFVELSRLL